MDPPLNHRHVCAHLISPKYFMTSLFQPAPSIIIDNALKYVSHIKVKIPHCFEWLLDKHYFVSEGDGWVEPDLAQYQNGA